MEQRIKGILSDHPLDAAGIDALLDIVDEHPTFVFLAAMLLRRCSDALPPERLDRLRATVALGAADRQAMLDLADMSGFDWSHFYPAPKAPEKKSTVDTIDDFIEAYGHSSPEEDRLIEKLIFNPVAPDYFQGLDEPLDPADPLALPPELQPTPEPKPAAPPAFHGVPATASEVSEASEASELSDNSNNSNSSNYSNNSNSSNNSNNSNPDAAESPLLMESLAKIFIKQRRYERALEIISKLSLNNPEKSVYFADQIRFLQKLVYNDHKKNQL